LDKIRVKILNIAFKTKYLNDVQDERKKTKVANRGKGGVALWGITGFEAVV